MELLNKISSTTNEIFQFLFSTYTGIIILVVACLFITLLISVLLEFKTKRQFVDHETYEAKEEIDN